MPAGTPDDDKTDLERYGALAALLLTGLDPEPERPADELAPLRRRRLDEHTLARSRHPSARAERSA